MKNFYAVWGKNGFGVFDSWDAARDARDDLMAGNCKKFSGMKSAKDFMIHEFQHLNKGCAYKTLEDIDFQLNRLIVEVQDMD